jgi:NAD-specific glutamate dehydrogenase
MVGMRHRSRVWGTLIPLALAAAVMAHSNEPTLEELKARVASASVRDRPHLCVEIAQKQLTEADKLYAASDFDKGQAALTDVVAYSELARDYAIQSHKYQKQTEIATRNMTRKLNDLLHSLGGPDQAPVRDAINRLQRVRDDLLAAMFPKGAK